ncbi:hypothetical protein ACHAL6_00530 [Proteiniclasticum sp. C24MP]
MAKIKWKAKEEKDKDQNERDKFKGKDFKTLSRKEKDEILEKIARQMGLL